MDNRRLADPGTPAFQVRKYPFYLLNRLVGRYNTVVAAKLRPLELDIPTWRVLMILGEQEPQGIREIADAAVIPLSTMTRIVQRMQTAALVEAFESAQDARVTEIRLTSLGRKKLEGARRATTQVYSQVIDGVTSAEFDLLIGLLDRLHNNLERHLMR